MQEKEKNGLQKLAELTGQSEDSIMASVLRVKENLRKLNSCSYHEFSLMPGFKETDFKRRYSCRHCGGTVDESAYSWHEKGRRERPA